MHFDNEIHTLNDDELAKIGGGILEPTTGPIGPYPPDGTVYIRFVSDTEVGPWILLTEESLKEAELKKAAGYQIQYIVISR